MAAHNIYDAKTNFSALADKAVRGEEVVIAKAGTAVARIVPLQSQPESQTYYRKAGRNVAGWANVPKEIDYPLPDHIKQALGMLA